MSVAIGGNRMLRVNYVAAQLLQRLLAAEQMVELVLEHAEPDSVKSFVDEYRAQTQQTQAIVNEMQKYVWVRPTALRLPC